MILAAGHHALICDRTLLEVLGDVASLAIARRESEPLAKFWRTHRERYTAFDRIRVLRDPALVGRVRALTANLQCTRYSATANAHALVVEARWLGGDPRVSRSAQRALATRVTRLEHLLATEAPDAIVDHEVGDVRAALVALDACDLRAALATADRTSFGALMEACCVVGLDGDIGLGTLGTHTLAAGKPLFAVPYISASEAPPLSLVERVVARTGEYSAAAANALFADDARALCGGFQIAPTWYSGATLHEAAAYAGACAQRLDREDPLARELARLREQMIDAAHDDHAVLEWIA
jgi:hypothetical protein